MNYFASLQKRILGNYLGYKSFGGTETQANLESGKQW